MTASEVIALIALIAFFFLTLGLSPLARRNRSDAPIKLPSKSRLAIKSVSLLTAVFSLLLLAFLFSELRKEFVEQDIRRALGYVALAVIPAICVWASFQGWRMRRRGVVSICSAWLLFGWWGFSVSLLHLVRGLWDSFDLAGLAIWGCVYVVGLIVGQQEKYFA